MGSCCGCCARSIPAARNPSMRQPAAPRLNPLEAANGESGSAKSASYSTSSPDTDDGTTTSSSSSSLAPTSPPSSSRSSSHTPNLGSDGSGSRSFGSVDVFSVESDPEERSRRAAQSFMQWRNKEYVPLNSEEKRAIKEYRKAVASEEGTYMSSRAQRPRADGPRREVTREGECIVLDDPVENRALKRRNSQIRFTQAVAAPVAPDIHNEAVLVPLEDGVEIPALRPTASILSKASIADVVDVVPFYGSDDAEAPSDSSRSLEPQNDRDYVL